MNALLLQKLTINQSNWTQVGAHPFLPIYTKMHLDAKCSTNISIAPVYNMSFHFIPRLRKGHLGCRKITSLWESSPKDYTTVNQSTCSDYKKRVILNDLRRRWVCRIIRKFVEVLWVLGMSTICQLGTIYMNKMNFNNKSLQLKEIAFMTTTRSLKTHNQYQITQNESIDHTSTRNSLNSLSF